MVGREDDERWIFFLFAVGGRGKYRGAVTTLIVVFREGCACFAQRGQIIDV